MQLTFLLGADHIVLYEWKTSPTIGAVVQHYAARCRRDHSSSSQPHPQQCPRVDVIDWRLPDSIANSIWYRWGLTSRLIYYSFIL